MSDFSHEPERISRLETWALALATALVALIAIGIVRTCIGKGTFHDNCNNLERAPLAS